MIIGSSGGSALGFTPQRVYSPKDYGGQTFAGIRAAIAACSAAGGGTVVLDDRAYTHDGTPITMAQGVTLRGTHKPGWQPPGGPAGTRLEASTSLSVPTVQLKDPATSTLATSATLEGLYFIGGSDCIFSSGSSWVILRDLSMSNFAGSGIRLQGQQEQWVVDTLEIGGGTYGLRHEEYGLGDAGGMPSMQKSAWYNCHFTSLQKGIVSDTNSGGINLFVNTRLDWLQQGAIILKGGQGQWTFLNTTFERCYGGLSAVPTASTTGSVAAASTQLSVASASGFQIGQQITVTGAGSGGKDLSTTLAGISGTTFTLAVAASGTVSGVRVTNQTTSEIWIGLSSIPGGNVPTNICFINANFGWTNCLYGLDASGCTGQISLINCSTNPDHPVYDPNWVVWCDAPADNLAAPFIQRPPPALYPGGPLGAFARTILPAAYSPASQFTSPPGGDVIVGLVGGDAVRGRYQRSAPALGPGHFRVWSSAQPAYPWLDVDAQTGRTTQTVPNSAPGDSSLGAGQVSLYLDEVSGQLKARVKYSDGTLKTGALALS